ncbi:MAG TPA: circadian clock KaiB family protein [Pyrinomonadaceae bacterium]|jgi:circadian clock protein KaiB|nr:circadian clock KaiB family protein [Pyrinomonadaceae bacterium]
MAKPKNEIEKSNGKRDLQNKLRSTTDVFEDALKKKPLRRAKYIFRLYVTGSSTRSLRAIYNLRKLLEEYLHDEYDLKVIDIYKNPDAAREEQIIAAPTLVKQLPQPLRRFIGDLSNTRKLLVGLDIYEDAKDQLGGTH